MNYVECLEAMLRATEGENFSPVALDIDQGELWRAPAVDAMFGYAPGEAGNHLLAFWGRLDPRDERLVRRRFWRALSRGEVIRERFR
ncbi:MAG: PAS domain-containing protein, partial [Rhodospirillales bacterium]|nr:PAS domain-containing protein [Rhodospirillales bacterium]